MPDSDKSVADIIRDTTAQLDQKKDIIYLMMAGTKNEDDSIAKSIISIQGESSCLIPMLSNVIIAMANSQNNSINNFLTTLALDIDLRLENPDE